jgi:hypothetical protein
MNSEEIEAWYDAQKLRLTEEFQFELKKQGNQNSVKVQKVFEPKFKKLVADYNAKYQHTFESEARKKIIKTKLDQIKKQLEQIVKKKE